MPRDVRLPEMETPVAYQRIPSKLEKILWVIDAPLLQRLKDPEILKVAQINIKYRIKLAELEAEALKAEVEALQEVGKALGR